MIYDDYDDDDDNDDDYDDDDDDNTNNIFFIKIMKMTMTITITDCSTPIYSSSPFHWFYFGPACLNTSIVEYFRETPCVYIVS